MEHNLKYALIISAVALAIITGFSLVAVMTA
ncbi:cytochrome bd-I oxidase subunit CydH [Vibrio atypicus]|nr:YnhF family membrane protein [Vibrio atypicus]